MPIPISSIPEFWASNVAVATGDIADSAITAAKILDSTITGAKLTTASRTKVISVQVGTIATAAGTTELLIIAPFAGVIGGVRFTAKDALAANDTNYITFAIKNKGQAGAGTTDILDTSATNTTKATGGTALAAYTTRQLTNHGTAANLNVAQGDTLAIQFVVTGTLANTVTESNIQINVQVSV